MAFDHLQRPVEAVEQMKKAMASINERQRAFVGLFTIHFLRQTTFEHGDTAPLIQLLEIEMERLAEPFLTPPKTVVTALNIQRRLKNMVDERLERLPDLIDQLTPKEQVNVLLKMASLVMPSVQSAHYGDGEPDETSYFEVSPLKKARSLKIEAPFSEKK